MAITSKVLPVFIEKETNIDRPAEEVFQYVKDFSQIYEWDNQVVEAQRLDLAPIKEGAKFKIVYSFMGVTQDLIYNIETIGSSADHHYLQLSARAKMFSATDRIEVHSVTEDSCRLVYSADIKFTISQTEPFVRVYMERVGNVLMKRLRIALEKANECEPPQKYLNPLSVPFWFTRKGWNQRRKGFKATLSCPRKILITGPTSGLGRSITTTLAAKGCSFVLVARSSSKLEQLKADLYNLGFEGTLKSYVCDMADLKTVVATCNKIIDDDQVPDVLINNAAALYAKPLEIDGVERTTVVDLIAPWLIAQKLSPQMLAGSCIINVTSGGMYAAGLDITELKRARKPFSGSRAYALAKRGLDVMSWGLNEKLKEAGIRVHSMHPGWADTPGVVDSLPGFHKVTKRWLRNPFQGSDTIVWLAMNNPEQGGEFWLDRVRQSRYLMPAGGRSMPDDYLRLSNFLGQFSGPVASHC